MKSSELKNQEETIKLFEDALEGEDNKALAKAMVDKFNGIEDAILEKFNELKDEHDATVLASRGIRQLTDAEIKFYQDLFSNEIGMSPTQGGSKIMPKTIFESIFDDLREDTDDNPLAGIDLVNTTGTTEWIVSVADRPTATWGAMCDPITKELSVGYKVVNTLVNKLSCYIPYCKSLIDLGPTWQDAYVREYIKLGLKYALIEAAISGNGSNAPWGMAYNYDIDNDTAEMKTPVTIKSLTRGEFKSIFKSMATNPMGNHRSVKDATLYVNFEDYYDHIYENDVYYDLNGTEFSRLARLGIKLCVCETGLAQGLAVLGLPKRYFMQVAMKGGGQNGMVEFSDDYLFLEDKRVYKAKLFADGFAKDNNAFALLDISGLTNGNVIDVKVKNTNEEPVITKEAAASV